MQKKQTNKTVPNLTRGKGGGEIWEINVKMESKCCVQVKKTLGGQLKFKDKFAVLKTDQSLFCLEVCDWRMQNTKQMSKSAVFFPADFGAKERLVCTLDSDLI